MRVLRGHPGFTAAAVATLALGIGANTALFSVFDALLLKPLPVANPAGLVLLGARNSRGEPNREFSYPVFNELRSRSRTLAALAAATSGEDRMQVRVPPSTDPEPFKIALVSRNFFDVFGVRPALGTLFDRGLDTGREPNAAVAVLSHRAWTARFNHLPSVVGTTIFVQNVPFRIAGVAPASFFGHVVGEAPDIWLPADQQPALWAGLSYLDRTGVDWVMLLGRAQPGVAIAQVHAELSTTIRAI